MEKYTLQMLLLLCTTLRTSEAYCPSKYEKTFAECQFQIQCFNYKLSGFQLPDKCQGSSNYDVVLDVNLREDYENFSNDTDTSFLKSIATLRVSGDWPKTDLSFLGDMPELRNLYLVNSKIDNVIETPFYNLTSLEILDLSFNSLKDITMLFKFKDQENVLSTLNLAHNGITEISRDSFEELIELTELNLSHNNIEDVTSEPFHFLFNLETLNLDYNKIRDVNGALNNLKNLKHLYIRNNMLQHVDESVEVHRISHLLTYDVSGNKLDSLNPTAFLRHWDHFDDNTICRIILSNNQIAAVRNPDLADISKRFTRHLDNAISPSDVVTELDMSENNIETIEYNAFQDIERLVYLDLSNNKIESFTVNPSHLVSVQHLNLSGNVISDSVFQVFRDLPSLQIIDLSHNTLEVLPHDAFDRNYELKFVNITFNRIKELIYLHIISHVNNARADFSNNEISTVSAVKGVKNQITHLNLRFNNISNLCYVELHFQTELQSLDLSNNDIETINEVCLRLPYNLQELDISHNKLESISPSAFVHLGKLVSLNMAHNRLSILEYGTFQGLTNLKMLDLSYNEIILLTYKVIGELKMLQYLSLRFNKVEKLDLASWFSPLSYLTVDIEGNELPCDWLRKAVDNFNRGYSKVRLTAVQRRMEGNSVDGIPCSSSKIEKYENFNEYSDKTLTSVNDERLLLLNKNILETLKDQTHYLRLILGTMKSYVNSTHNFKIKF